jgi:hypothetical protein
MFGPKGGKQSGESWKDPYLGMEFVYVKGSHFEMGILMVLVAMMRTLSIGFAWMDSGFASIK